MKAQEFRHREQKLQEHQVRLRLHNQEEIHNQVTEIQEVAEEIS